VKNYFGIKSLTYAFLFVLLAVGCQKTVSPIVPAPPSIASAVVTGHCSLSMGFWKTHNKTAGQPSLKMPWPTCGQDPQGEDTTLCGMTWLSLLQTSPSGNAWNILARQWIAAELNVCSGVQTPPDILQDMAQAQTLLTGNCAFLDPASPDGQQAITLSSLLEGYNSGNVGANCSTPTMTPTPTGFPTATPTVTATPTPVPAPLIGLVKTASESTALTGDVVLYTIQVSIEGSQAGNLQIQDILPNGMDFVPGSESDTLGAVFTASGSVLTWTAPQAGPCSCSITYQTRVNSFIEVGSIMTNQAVLSSSSLSAPVSASSSVLNAGVPTPTPTP